MRTLPVSSRLEPESGSYLPKETPVALTVQVHSAHAAEAGSGSASSKIKIWRNVFFIASSLSMLSSRFDSAAGPAPQIGERRAVGRQFQSDVARLMLPDYEQVICLAKVRQEHFAVLA